MIAPTFTVYQSRSEAKQTSVSSMLSLLAFAFFFWAAFIMPDGTDITAPFKQLTVLCDSAMAQKVAFTSTGAAASMQSEAIVDPYAELVAPRYPPVVARLR